MEPASIIKQIVFSDGLMNAITDYRWHADVHGEHHVFILEFGVAREALGTKATLGQEKLLELEHGERIKRACLIAARRTPGTRVANRIEIRLEVRDFAPAT